MYRDKGGKSHDDANHFAGIKFLIGRCGINSRGRSQHRRQRKTNSSHEFLPHDGFLSHRVRIASQST
jgi:hypothetical protein